MYLKRIEMHGFKSFSKKTVLEFHNGITGIVGPNGSGKSNISDAVRWVLGEQSARQLRGASMQDVIFAGTESRKALSFAYVAITFDNSDHVLPFDYEEVTVSRRVYRSGESEYQINKVNCRLKDVQELFYDTGIGKDGYSIIGQGQIERILSSKPEDRRELFDEAVGIVKYKKRKDAAIKQLNDEKANLERITDILNELEQRVGPLKEQAQNAKHFVELRDRQKKLEINLFLYDHERLRATEASLLSKRNTLRDELEELKAENDKITSSYDSYESQINDLEKQLELLRESQMETTRIKGNLSTQIELCKEQINSAIQRKEDLASRIKTVQENKSAHKKQLEEFTDKRSEVNKLLEEVNGRLKKASDYNKELSDDIKSGSQKIDKLNEELIDLLNERNHIVSDKQRFETMIEQENINKATLNQRQLSQKTRLDDLIDKKRVSNDEYEKASAEVSSIDKEAKALEERLKALTEKSNIEAKLIEDKKREYSLIYSKLDALKNLAERYEGYGSAVRKVMELKHDYPEIVGVVSDLFSVESKFETAIETALGGNIQNVVTEDEKSAKEIVNYLKSNRLGRVTFLPLTNVIKPKVVDGDDILSEKGVEGLASDLIACEDRFSNIAKYLLGRVVVCTSMDDGLKLAKKYKYAHHIVTLDGEYLRPGGSITGGAFKNSSNLLGRNREIEELTNSRDALDKEIKEALSRKEEYDTAIELVSDDIKAKNEEAKEALISANTAKIHMENANNEYDSASKLQEELHDEKRELEERLIDISVKKEEMALLISESNKREESIKEEITKLEDEVDKKRFLENTAARNLSEIQIEEASARQEVNFVEDNIERVNEEISKNENEENEISTAISDCENEIKIKNKQIEDVLGTIENAEYSSEDLSKQMEEASNQKEKMQLEHKRLFEKKQELFDNINKLEKEDVRLEASEERTKEEFRLINSHIWNEYELTLHAAMELKDESLETKEPSELKKEVTSIKDEIRGLGDVNVSAIEEYKEVSERHEFLSGQYNDIVESEKRLSEIIDELDEGMRKRFKEGFAKIGEQFDIVFKELFGGGKGTLELSDEGDILESGIKIIAQPPGKKLQNMMQMSGGEKAFTAIALLFAILNLKPAPFCLLDEIEAALDEQNVDRFSKYLRKLTGESQFIIITHRRGTMNAADRLYGITMQEKGISTLVSVSLIEDELDE